jgi:hypothetical protein
MTTPKIESVDVYGSNGPDAATFGKGARDLAGIREATTARDNLSTRQSTTMPTTESIPDRMQYKPKR